SNRGVRRALAPPGYARADVPVFGDCVAGSRRRPREPGVGPAAQIPDPSRSADARAVRELSARRRAARKTGRLGADGFMLRARLGRVPAAEAGRSPSAYSWWRDASGLDHVAGPTAQDDARRRSAPRP